MAAAGMDAAFISKVTNLTEDKVRSVIDTVKQ